MPDEQRPIEWVRVRSGHRIYRARRFGTGSWWVEDDQGFHLTTLNNKDFLAQFDKVPDDIK